MWLYGINYFRIHMYCLTEDFITAATSESTNQLLPTISWLTDTLLYKIVGNLILVVIGL